MPILKNPGLWLNLANIFSLYHFYLERENKILKTKMLLCLINGGKHEPWRISNHRVYRGQTPGAERKWRAEHTLVHSAGISKQLSTLKHGSSDS